MRASWIRVAAAIGYVVSTGGPAEQPLRDSSLDARPLGSGAVSESSTDATAGRLLMFTGSDALLTAQATAQAMNGRKSTHDPDDCDGNSQSFNAGCRAYTEGRDGDDESLRQSVHPVDGSHSSRISECAVA
jgi:hypothetical protein